MLAAKWEVEQQGNIENGRTLLQRAIRLCPSERRIWIEYFRLELWFTKKIADQVVYKMQKNQQTGENQSPAGSAESIDLDAINFDSQSQDANESLNYFLKGSLPLIVYNAATDGSFSFLALPVV